MSELNIESHIAKHEQCAKILEMIERNRRYLLSDISGSQSEDMFLIGMRNHYKQRAEIRKKIHNRLIAYYAKKVALIGIDAYNAAYQLNKPIKSTNNQ